MTHHHHHHHHHLHELPRCSCAVLELISVSHPFYVIPIVPANSPQINPKCGHRGRPKTRAAQNQCCKMQIAENHSGTMCDRSRRPPMEPDYSEFRFPIIYQLCTSQAQHLFARTILSDTDREFRLLAMRRRTIQAQCVIAVAALRWSWTIVNLDSHHL